MTIDWSKERCSVCGGEFKPSSVQVTNEQTGKTSTLRVMACVRCGDTAFSPEQHVAHKVKQVSQELRPPLSCGSSACPGCVNCGRGLSNRCLNLALAGATESLQKRNSKRNTRQELLGTNYEQTASHLCRS